MTCDANDAAAGVEGMLRGERVGDAAPSLAVAATDDVA